MHSYFDHGILSLALVPCSDTSRQCSRLSHNTPSNTTSLASHSRISVLVISRGFLAALGRQAVSHSTDDLPGPSRAHLICQVSSLLPCPRCSSPIEPVRRVRMNPDWVKVQDPTPFSAATPLSISVVAHSMLPGFNTKPFANETQNKRGKLTTEAVSFCLKPWDQYARLGGRVMPASGAASLVQRCDPALSSASR